MDCQNCKHYACDSPECFMDHEVIFCENDEKCHDEESCDG